MTLSIADRIILLVDERAKEPVTLDSRLADLGCDYITLAIQFDVMDEFELELSDAEAKSAKTVRDLVNIVSERTGAKAA